MTLYDQEVKDMHVVKSTYSWGPREARELRTGFDGPFDEQDHAATLAARLGGEVIPVLRTEEREEDFAASHRPAQWGVRRYFHIPGAVLRKGTCGGLFPVQGGAS